MGHHQERDAVLPAPLRRQHGLAVVAVQRRNHILGWCLTTLTLTALQCFANLRKGVCCMLMRILFVLLAQHCTGELMELALANIAMNCCIYSHPIACRQEMIFRCLFLEPVSCLYLCCLFGIGLLKCVSIPNGRTGILFN